MKLIDMLLRRPVPEKKPSRELREARVAVKILNRAADVVVEEARRIERLVENG